MIVGEDPQSRGVVATCSYKARRFGIYSAMACSTAYKRCRHAVFVRPRFDVYKSGIPSATQIAQQIRQQIVQATGGLTASAGVSFNKFLAKVASDVSKPDGITVITPDQAPAYIDQLPI